MLAANNIMLMEWGVQYDIPMAPPWPSAKTYFFFVWSVLKTHTMAFDSQTAQRKSSIFKSSLRFLEVAAGVFVQKVPVRYLTRLSSDDADEDDPLVSALRDLPNTFKDCVEKAVDMESSVEAIVGEYKANKHNRGMVLLAWRLTFDSARRQMNTPRLVGMLTLSDFTPSPAFSTDRESLSRQDWDRLRPYFEKNWLYIDAMCSVQSGVGRLLVQTAYQVALAQKRDGLIGLSFSSRRSSTPESKRIFEDLGFETLIPNASFTVRLYGTWFTKSTSAVDLSGMATDAVRVCTRRGLQARTVGTWFWRCPQ